ncbi:hypothetical protein [Phormidesmis priestleyi]
MHIKHIAAACLAGCTALVIAATAALAQLATVTSMELSVRRGPGFNYPSNFTLKQGDRVEVTQRQEIGHSLLEREGARGGLMLASCR